MGGNQYPVCLSQPLYAICFQGRLRFFYGQNFEQAGSCISIRTSINNTMIDPIIHAITLPVFAKTDLFFLGDAGVSDSLFFMGNLKLAVSQNLKPKNTGVVRWNQKRIVKLRKTRRDSDKMRELNF